MVCKYVLSNKGKLLARFWSSRSTAKEAIRKLRRGSRAVNLESYGGELDETTTKLLLIAVVRPVDNRMDFLIFFLLKVCLCYWPGSICFFSP